ncbi:MAG: MerR family transcriptional regulator [Proteobacteria bacterium]|nr:MerR family transcriptional regulator [Pseudomonadota bacterium]NIS71854.1 MerR family transcriptional regulator [Pseudomonadota bacterium]
MGDSLKSEQKPFVDKIYHRIGEVSRITGVKPHVLRYWESEFKEIKPLKSRSLQRLYRKKDLELIFHIKRLLYEDGYTIAGARSKIKELAQSDRKQMKIDFDKEKIEAIIHDLKTELKGIRQILE